MNTTYQFLAARPRWFIVSAGWLLIAFVAAFDFQVGRYVDLGLFYLPPIILVTWFSDKIGALTAAIAAIFISLIDRPLELAALQDVSEATLGALGFLVWITFVKLAFFLASVILLSRLKERTVHLQQLASQDALTQIANRRSLNRALEVELNRARRSESKSKFSVAYIDLDNFKRVNDRHGHLAGDHFLRHIAETMRRHTRNMDTVARLGGDEFAIVLPETDQPHAKQAMVKIQRLLARTIARDLQQKEASSWIRSNGTPLGVTSSIGVVTFNKPPKSPDQILRAADHAMYSIKRKGKGSMVFEIWPPPRKGGR